MRSTMPSPVPCEIAVVGGGPAGLAAAEAAAGAGGRVTLYDRMPSLGRKLLMAGRGGLNLTHGEPLARFLARYGAAEPRLRAAIEAFDPDALRFWAEGLGQPTFLGSSGRVFPQAWKASPLLRAWLVRLDRLGVRVVPRHDWLGFGPDGASLLAGADGRPVELRPAATVLALGGASWPRLGATGRWLSAFEALGIGTSALRPANCALHLSWSNRFGARFAGTPLKRVAFGFGGRCVRGEAVVTAAGLEGGAVYALSGAIRDALDAGRVPVLTVDLRPDRPLADLCRMLARPRGRQSASTFLRKAAGLPPVAVALLREAADGLPTEPESLAALVKAAPLVVTGTGGLDRAISSAGGVRFEEVDGNFMLRRRPGVFVAGEMLDWEAPTGGYLLQACLSTGRAAGLAAASWALDLGADAA